MSCEKQTTWQVEGNSDLKLIVEGEITNENRQHLVKLTLPVSLLNEPVKPASGAVVRIIDRSNIWSFTESPANSGLYYSDSTIIGGIDLRYNLVVRYKSDIFTAHSRMVPVSPLKSLKYEQVSDSTGFYQFVYEESSEPSMLEVYVDWSNLNGYNTIDSLKRKAKLIFYTLETVDVSEFFRPEQEKIYFPKGATIIRKKYSLNDDEQEFIRSLLLETTWRGGRFDVIPDNVITNLSEGAAGYFGAYTVVTDTSIVN
jgi:hypothetical protein